MASTSETVLNSPHAFKAVVVERGLEHLWDCFERKKITTWSAMGLVLGFSPHESSDSLSQKWVEQVLLPLCLLTAGDNKNEHCITVRRLHLDRRVDAEHAADHHAHDEGRRPTMQPAPWETAPSLGDILLCGRRHPAVQPPAAGRLCARSPAEAGQRLPRLHPGS